MKYALQIYGQLRTFDTCLPSLLRFIDYYNKDYDVFLLIDKGHMKGYDYSAMYPSNYSEETMEDLYLILKRENVKQLRYTDEFTAEEQARESVLLAEYQQLWLKFNEAHGNITKNDFVAALMYRKYLLNQMRVQYEEEHGITYDYVVRTRFDWATTLPVTYDINSNTTPILFSDALTIGSPEFVNTESEIGLVFPFTPKCLFDDECTLLTEKYKQYESWRGDKFIDKQWIFMPELNQRLFLLEQGCTFIEAWWKEPCNYGFRIVR